MAKLFSLKGMGIKMPKVGLTSRVMFGPGISKAEIFPKTAWKSARRGRRRRSW